MKIINNVNIRKQIILYTILFLLLFGGIIAMTQYYLNQCQKSEEICKTTLLIKSKIQNLKIHENEILTNDIKNADFFSEQNSDNLHRFRTEYASILLLSDEHLADSSQSIIDSLQLSDFHNLVDNYKMSFDSLVDKIFVKGFKDYGLIGIFRLSAHQAEDYISQTENDALYNHLLNMRRHEKDFLLRNDLMYVDKFRNSHDQFVMDLANTPGLNDTEQVTSIISDYASNFYKVVDAQNEISANNKGLLHRVDESYSQIFPVLDNMVVNTDAHRKAMLSNVRLSLTITLTIAAILAVLLFLRLNLLITKPINTLNARINQLSTGDISEKMVDINGKNEIASMGRAVNKLIEGLKNTVSFANDIRIGKYDSEYEPLSEKDTLGKSLLEMRASLIKAEEESTLQREQEKQQNWINAGSVKFSEILNQNYDDTNEFAFSVISNLVKYLDANQGGIFLVNDDNPNDIHLELRSAFAFNRRKYLQKRIELGEGFVGTSVLEKNLIYRTEIPNDYISITSGLGEANPKVLLIVPLVLEDDFYGAIEIASFHEFKDYELEFVRSISETIASTISSVRSKERTEKLLAQTRDQAEQITQTEEEMRQNMEELQATQEEMARKQNELEQRKQLMENVLDTIPVPVFVKDENRKYYLVNTQEVNLFKVPKDNILGHTESEIVKDEESVRVADESDNQVLLENKKMEMPQQRIKLNNGTERFFKTIKIPFINNITNTTNILGISLEISDDNHQELLLANEKIEMLTRQVEHLSGNS